MRRLKKWLGSLLSTLHPSPRHPRRGAPNPLKSTAGVTRSQSTPSAARKPLWPKLDWGSSHVSASCKRRIIQKGTLEPSSHNRTKADAFDPAGINAIIQVDMEEGRRQSIPTRNTALRAQRRGSRRVSVTGLPTRHKKVSHRKKRKMFSFRKRQKPVESRRKQSGVTIVKLQTQIDGLVETVADCSVKLLAKRQAELEHCEVMGNRIQDASRQFQRVASKGSQRRRWKKVCVLCTCCC